MLVSPLGDPGEFVVLDSESQESVEPNVKHPQSLTHKFTAREVREAAKGQWLSIFRSLAPMELREAIAIVGTTRHVECPVHGGKHSDAFRLFPNVQETGGGVCNSCGKCQDGFKLLIWIKGWQFDQCVQEVAAALGMAPQPKGKQQKKKSTKTKKPVDPSPDQQPTYRTKPTEAEIAETRHRLRQRWAEASSLPDATERISLYLRHRGLSGAVPPTLRFTPDLPYFHEATQSTTKTDGQATDQFTEPFHEPFPAMLAQVTSASPKVGLAALHRTYLAPESDSENFPGKANVPSPKKLTTPVFDGATRGAAIRLYPIPNHSSSQVSSESSKTKESNSPPPTNNKENPQRITLAIAEGIETAIAIYEATSTPTWSTVSAGGMENFELPKSPKIQQLEIWADQGEAGQHAANSLAERFSTSHPGMEIVVVTPDESLTGGNSQLDWLDIFVANGSESLISARDRAVPFVPAEPVTPKIIIRTKEHEVTDEAIAALAADPQVYQRAGMLCHVITHSHARSKTINRSPNSPYISPLSEHTLRSRLTACADWISLKADRETGKITEESAHPPAWAVKQVFHAQFWPGVRHLESVIETPILTPEGKVIAMSGYDESSGILCLITDQFPPIPSNPTKADAAAAVQTLLEVVADFPFATTTKNITFDQSVELQTYRSAWLASVLTPLARSAFSGPSPLFLVDANVRGAGKSLLCDLAGIIATGRELPRTVNAAEEEMRKRITATAIAGDPIVLIDNIADKLGCPSLDAVLTSTEWTDRVLGKSETTKSIPMLTTWYATGNNVMLRGDIARRTLHIRIESPEEKPEERANFTHRNIKTWTLTNRPRLVSAALTILRAFFAAGCPDQSLSPWGSFDGWSNLIRGAIVFAGEPDPAETRTELAETADTDSQAIRKLIQGWELMDPFNEGMTIAHVLKQITDPAGEAFRDAAQDVFGHSGEDSGNGLEMVKDAILELCPTRTGKIPTARSIGMKLHNLKGRVFAGKCLEKRSCTDHVIKYAVATQSKEGGLQFSTKSSPRSSPLDISPLQDLLPGTKGTKGTKKGGHEISESVNDEIVDNQSFPQKSTDGGRSNPFSPISPLPATTGIDSNHEIDSTCDKNNGRGLEKSSPRPPDRIEEDI